MILHMDNFSVYGGNAGLMLEGVYAQNTSVTLPGDPSGAAGNVARISFISGSTLGTLRHVLSAESLTVGVAQRVWCGSLPSSTSQRPVPVLFANSGNTGIAYIQITTTGRISAYIGNFDDSASGTLVGTTTNPVVTAGSWFHIETKLVCDPVNGSIEVRVEGATVLNLTGLNTGSSNISQIRHHNDPTPTGSGITFYLKDLVIWDSSGTQNTNFLGSVIVHSLIPTSDEALNWTPSTGTTGFPILDNAPPTADNLSATTPPPLAYVAGMSDLPADITSVRGIMTYVRAAKSDGGDGSLQVGLKSGASTALGVNRPITVSQTYWRDIFEVDPATSAAWTPTAVDAARLQLNRTL